MKILAFALFLTVFSVGASPLQAEEAHPEPPEYKDVKLTDEQLTELKSLYEDMMKQRKGIIDKYLELGILTEKDAKNMKEHLDMYFKKLENDSFIPKWDKHKKHPKKDE
ncbi:DUF2680 domain-containing protein [Radiobacillus sp. PE A8.2]|uniref:DUF2680 domain-containing protein n=1 Tax=Radiobacillus sp. PE A8.2 TaxID=3380349 RepID=UPI00388F5339